MENLAKRVKFGRKRMGMSQDALALAAGVGQGDISKIETGRILKTTSIVSLARALRCDPHWLESGEGSPQWDGKENLNPGPEFKGLVPLISLVQAGSWSEIAETFQPGDAEEWLPCPRRHSSKTFCLTVKGDSMHNPGSKPSYADGDIIFVDPELAAQVGDRVVVRLDEKDEATFKQLMEEDGRRYLKALNPDWKPRYIEINGNATICGVVIGKWVPE